MPRVGFELTIPVFELTKTAHALRSVATVIGLVHYGNIWKQTEAMFENIGTESSDDLIWS
jgi:isocitrate dehydrogenase